MIYKINPDRSTPWNELPESQVYSLILLLKQAKIQLKKNYKLGRRKTIFV